MKKIICSARWIKKKCLVICSLILSVYIPASASCINPYIKDPGLTNDGPYIFLEEDIFRIKWIENSQSKEEELTYLNYDEFKGKFNLLSNFNEIRCLSNKKRIPLNL